MFGNANVDRTVIWSRPQWEVIRMNLVGRDKKGGNPSSIEIVRQMNPDNCIGIVKIMSFAMAMLGII
jgi:hypothetical protein